MDYTILHLIWGSKEHINVGLPAPKLFVSGLSQYPVFLYPVFI
jgi:hypothetical protein